MWVWVIRELIYYFQLIAYNLPPTTNVYYARIDKEGEGENMLVIKLIKIYMPTKNPNKITTRQIESILENMGDKYREELIKNNQPSVEEAEKFAKKVIEHIDVEKPKA